MDVKAACYFGKLVSTNLPVNNPVDNILALVAEPDSKYVDNCVNNLIHSLVHSCDNTTKTRLTKRVWGRSPGPEY